MGSKKDSFDALSIGADGVPGLAESTAQLPMAAARALGEIIDDAPEGGGGKNWDKRRAQELMNKVKEIAPE